MPSAIPPSPNPIPFIHGSQPPRRRVWPWILAGVLLFAGLPCCGIVWWGIAWLNRLAGPVSSPAEPGNRWDTPEERRVALRAAFNGEARQIADPALEELRKFLADVAEASKREDNVALERLVDVRRFVDRLLCHPSASTYTRVERLSLPIAVRGQLEGMGDVDDFEIVSITRWPNSTEILVYVWARSATLEADPHRLWLCRPGGEWKLFDWERVEFGLTETERFVVHNAAGKERKGASYDMLDAALIRSDSLTTQGKLVEAAAELKQAEQIRVPPSVHDYCQFLIAARWFNLSELDDCLRVCQQARQPEAMPGFFSFQATAFESFNQPQEALTAADNYERACGVHPENLQRQARSYERLGRRDESRDAWRRALRILPGNAASLASYSQSLPDDQKGSLVEFLQLAKSPVDTAAEILQRHSYTIDSSTMQVLVDFIEQQAPGSATLLSAKARVLEFEAEHEQAAELYQQAARQETDPARQKEFWGEYLSAMAQAGRAAEGYQNHPDPREALRQLAGGVEDGESEIDIEELPALVEAHRRRAPDDPWLHYYAGHAAREKKKYAEAEREFAAAENALGDEDRDFARGYRLEMWCRQGRALEALAAFKNDPESYKDLAQHCTGDDLVDQLRELNAVRRQLAPNDPWLAYYEAMVLKHEKNYEPALDRLAAAEKSNDATLKNFTHWPREEILIELGRWQEAYRDAADRSQSFGRLTAQFRQRGEIDRLRELCDMHRRANPNAPELLPVEVESAWELADYERVVQLLTPWPKDLQPNNYNSTTMRLELVRSLLRLNRPDEAIARAREAATKPDDRFPLLVAMVAQRNVDEVRKLLEDETLIQRTLRGGVLHTDPELAPLDTDSEFAEIRREHPIGLPHEANDEFYMLLLKESHPLEAAELQARLGRTGATTAAPKIEQSSRSGEVWTVVEERRFTLLITVGTSPFVSAKKIDQLELRRPDLRRVLAEQKGWISVATISRPRDASRTDQSPARDLAARLCDENVVGFYYSLPNTYSFYLAAATEGAAQPLTSPLRIDEPLPGSIPLWLTRDDDEPEYANRQALSKKRQSLKALTRLLAEQPRERPQAKVLLRRGHTEEEQWLDVISGKHTRYGNFEFVAEFQTASKLWHHLTPGTRCSITNYEIVEWREC